MVFSNIRNGQKWSSIFNELFSDRRNSDERRVPRDNCSIPGSFFFGFLLAAPPPTPPVNLQTFNTKTNLVWCLFFFKYIILYALYVLYFWSIPVIKNNALPRNNDGFFSHPTLDSTIICWFVLFRFKVLADEVSFMYTLERNENWS